MPLDSLLLLSSTHVLEPVVIAKDHFVPKEVANGLIYILASKKVTQRG